MKLRFLPNAVSAQDKRRRIHPNCLTHILGPRVPNPLANATFVMETFIAFNTERSIRIFETKTITDQRFYYVEFGVTEDIPASLAA